MQELKKSPVKSLDRTDFKINIIKYLDRTKELKIIEENAVKYKIDHCSNLNNNYSPPLRLSIGLDYMLLVEIAGDFAALLIEEPYMAKKELSDLVKVSCNIIAECEDLTVYLLLRLTSFPQLLPKLESKNINPDGLFTKNGILANISPVEKYTQDVSFACKYINCFGDRSISKKRGKCSDCGKDLAEVARSRLTGEKVVGLLMDTNFLQPSSAVYSRTQAISVEFRDELLIGLELGIRYNVALTLEKGAFVAWGAVPMLPDPLVRAFSNISLPPFPVAVSSLIDRTKVASGNSPWSIVTAFASAIPGDAYPHSAFLHLKTALLLSLVSICSKSPIPILAIGDCGTLMIDTWHCSPRAIFSPSGPASLLMASYGVCLVHENNPSLSFVTTAVESELVTIADCKGPEDKRHSTYPLKSAIWTYWNCNRQNGQDVKKLRTLIDVFGIPFLDSIDVNDEKISEHILQKAFGDSFCSDIISQKDFRKFIDTISGLKVEMSDMASSLIKNYFVASRRERPECLPLKAIKVLTSMSESHARLSLRNIVTYEDAVAAIYLYEESINILFGPSVCSELPKRTITTEEPSEIARQMDAVLENFSQWLQSYTRNQSSTSQNSDFFDVHTSLFTHV